MLMPQQGRRYHLSAYLLFATPPCCLLQCSELDFHVIGRKEFRLLSLYSCQIVYGYEHQKSLYRPAQRVQHSVWLQVVQNGGQWRLAADDMPCSCMERRYFLRISLMDLSGSCEIILNNDQARATGAGRLY